MSLLIRPVQPEDAAGVVAVLNPIIAARAFTVLDRPLGVEAERDYISRFPARGVFLAAVRLPDQRIVGFQNLEPFATYTAAFDHVGTMATYVDLQCRRQGVARALFEATFPAARAKGFEKIFTFVRADNTAALQAYLAHGFRTIGTARRQARIDGRYIDAILIERFLE